MLLQLVEPGQTPPPHAQEESLAVGIDLGTTHSLIALIVDDTPQIIPVQGERLVPSAVYYAENGKPLVGQKALLMLQQESSNVVRSIKRYMHHASHRHIIGNNNLTPVQISADILRYLKTQAENQLGRSITQAVITVPAYFDETARTATRDAGRLAGLTILRLVNEPTAAALAYGLEKGVQGIYAVYDLGGGTFDLSLLRLQGGVFQVLATGGDTQLGGDDIDNALYEHLFRRDKTTSIDIKQVLYSIRLLKEQLSDQEIAFLDLKNHTLKITREQLDEIAKPIIERTIDHCQKVLKDAQVTKEEIKGVILVGGVTRMPLVKKIVENFFGKKPLDDINPDEVVAYGAALQASALTKGSKNLLLDVTPLSLGLETVGGIVEKIIERNSPLPITKVQEFTTYEDGQTAMLLHIVQGERELVHDCRSLARFELHGIPPLIAGIARIQVQFTVDVDGLLTVTAHEKSTGINQHVEIKPSYGLSECDLLEMVSNSFIHGHEDIEARLLIEAKVEAERILKITRSALMTDEFLLESSEKNNIVEALNELDKALIQEDRKQIEKATEGLTAATHPFAVKRMTYHLGLALKGQSIHSF